MNMHTRDPKRLVDMIFVKRLERRLGRALTEFELEEHEEAIAFCFPNGQIEKLSIPRLRFPQEVVTTFNASVAALTKRRERHKITNEEATSTIQLAKQNKRDAA